MSSFPSASTERSTDGGAAAYTPWFVRFFYDYLVLGLFNTFIWRAPTSRVLLPFFKSHVTSGTRSLLDIGVGTGYYLAAAPIDPQATVCLLDLNQNSLDVDTSRIATAHPAVQITAVHADVFDTQAITPHALGGPFDAISLMYLLHCLPGPPARKGELLSRLRTLLSQDGVLFGATVLGRDVQHSLLSRLAMRWLNHEKVFDNHDDGVQDFLAPLQQAFEHVEYFITGRVMCFEAKRPKDKTATG